MNSKLAFTFFILCFLIITNGQIQAQDEGEIVISEERLQDLAYKLYELKKSRSTVTDADKGTSEKQLKNLLLESDPKKEEKDIYKATEKLKIKSEERYKTSEKVMQTTEVRELVRYLDSFDKNQSNQNQKMMEELTSLREEIKELKNQQPEITIIDERNDDVVVRVNQRNLRSSQSAFMRESKTDTLRHNEIIARLDSLQLAMQKRDSIEVAPRSNEKLEDEMVRVKNQVYLLQAKIDQLIATPKDSLTDFDQRREIKQDTLIQTISVQEQMKNERDKIHAELVDQYGDFKKLVYFDNNSTQLKSSYEGLVVELTDLLAKEEQIDVLISGYASKTGAEDYNQMISMQRAHELKKQLMKKGVSPNRILTDYKGIDREASTLAEARRVEVELIIRR